MIDQAASFEFSKGLTIQYELGQYSSCLVEIDEEPPHPISMDAVNTCLIIALALNSKPVDELHVMRKIVIDGSNTTGFQRTLIVSIGGELKTSDHIVPIQAIFLEEDAGRLLDESDGVKKYGLDRLCVPLIEVALAPVTVSPKEVQDIAFSLGRLMRSTKLVSRGLGTIRQDINISILDGNVVEVKGVQKLELLEKIIEFEAFRQQNLINIKNELENRGLTPHDFKNKPVNVSSLFQKKSDSILGKALKKDMEIFALVFKKFSGLFCYEKFPDTRFGRELADVARFYGLGGVLHSDELPGYGVTSIEVGNIKQKLDITESDGFLILFGEKGRLLKASDAIQSRVQIAFNGVPAETRGPTPDGKTRFIRPRPGAARMYPETDIPPITITKTLVDLLKKKIPRPWEEQISEYVSKYSLSQKLAVQIDDSHYLDLFEELSSTTKLSPTLIAATLTETIVNLSRSGLDLKVLTDDKIRSMFFALDKKIISKEVIPQILELIISGDVNDVEGAIKKLGLIAVDDDELLVMVQKILNDNKALIDEKGSSSFSSLMGIVMSNLRGRADGQTISRILKLELNKMVSK